MTKIKLKFYKLLIFCAFSVLTLENSPNPPAFWSKWF